MAIYQPPDLISDEVTLAEQLLDAWASLIDDWEPRDGQLEPPFAEGIALVLATTNALLKDTARDGYADWGATVLGLQRHQASAATTTASVRMIDAEGHTAPAGLQLAAQLPSGDTAMFITLIEVMAPLGTQVVDGIPIAAVDAGEDANLAAGVADLVDPYDFIESVTLEAPATGGSTVEELPAYVDRLVDRARRQRAVPITVADFAAWPLDVAGVARCRAINLFDPATPGVEKPGHISIVPIDVNGEPVSPAVAQDALDAVTGEDERPLQVVPHVTQPTYTPVDVAFTITVVSGADPGSVVDAAQAAVRSYLSPATWGLDEQVAGRWRAIDVVYRFEIAQVIQQSNGVDLLQEVTLNGAEQDVALTGLVALPRPDDVTGTAVSS
jgi:uncharacterized phage protein gp47/JayE